MKIISWNLNGVKSSLNKGLKEVIAEHDADIYCFQETKTPAQPIQFELDNYEEFWNPAEKKGYSGTAILSKQKPKSIELGIQKKKHDQEGRVITATYDKFILVNVYVPNSKRKLERLDYRTKEWDVDFRKYLQKLDQEKPVIICGDLNVAHQEIDLTNPKTNHKNHGFTAEERKGFQDLLDAGFIDTFRHFSPDEPEHYTWWSPMNNCRQRNIGWRIDYFLCSTRFASKLKSSIILSEVFGSDHCPVQIEF